MNKIINYLAGNRRRTYNPINLTMHTDIIILEDSLMQVLHLENPQKKYKGGNIIYEDKNKCLICEVRPLPYLYFN